MAEPVNTLELANVTGVISSVAFLPEGIAVLLNRTRKELYFKRWNKVSPSAGFQTLPLGQYLDASFSPSDVQLQDLGSLLITFTSHQATAVIVFSYSLQPDGNVNLKEINRFQTGSRARSVASLGQEMYACLTAPSIDVVDIRGKKRANIRRSKPDRGGFVTSVTGDDGMRFLFGDYDEYVVCRWDGSNIIQENRFRYPGMKKPRSSTPDHGGNMLVACDTSHNVLRIPFGGSSTSCDVIVQETDDVQFGSIALHPKHNLVVVSTWKAVEQGGWPRVYRIM